MKNSVYEQGRARKVKARLRISYLAFFRSAKAFFYIWKKLFEKNGLGDLQDQPRRPHHIRYRIPREIVSLILYIREERRYGAFRASLYLQRHTTLTSPQRPF